MQKLEFVKAHGTGNDFVIVDMLRDNLEGVDLAQLAVRMCDRHFGIGADGLILVLPSEKANYRMRIINPDGTEAEMCGNGIRCLAKYLFDRGMVGDSMTVETIPGLKAVDVIAKDGLGVRFTVNMGIPRLEAEQIPVTGLSGQVVRYPLEVDETRFEVTCVSMGNPHCVIFINADDMPMQRLAIQRFGPRIENHPMFPKKTNVEFVQVLNDHEVRIRVWERGAGATLACGTGACAAVVAGVLNGTLGRKATVHLPGGDLLVDWREVGNVYMTGPAEEVFSGTFCM